MRLDFARRLTGRRRSAGADRQLAFGLAFVAGAARSAILVNHARPRRLHSEYALPLLLEALLLCFGVLGARLADVRGSFVPVTVMLLCFIMGLQYAVITKLSGAAMRRRTSPASSPTSAGKLLYWNGAGSSYECILCACCSSACPSQWWNPAACSRTARRPRWRGGCARQPAECSARGLRESEPARCRPRLSARGNKVTSAP
jgi:Protein of unknown function (DUF1275)